ncbi:MAG: radical SAM protein [bacterium]
MDKKILNHPCYSEQAKKKNARVHLPIIKRCNLSCGYCNRLYSCPNENRPGVTAKIITPEEALIVVQKAVETYSALTIIGIAGPGEALAEPETVYKTLKGVMDCFPYVNFCLSTNGYALVDNIELIKELKIEFITVTVNTVDPVVAEKIYLNCDVRQLIENQIAGIKALVKMGVCVKVNTVAVPNINTDVIADVAKMAAEIRAYAHNIMPFYPVEGSKFQDISAPSEELIEKVRKESSSYIRQLSHCNRCRADASGYLC